MRNLTRNIFLMLSFFSSLTARDNFVFAPLPTEDRETVYNDFYPMIKYLEKKLNITISVVYYDKYEEIIKNISEGKVDLAYLGPLPYVALKEKFNDVAPLVTFKDKEGLTSYTCSLVTSMHTTKKEKVALTQPLSTCGYLSVNTLLDKNLEKYHYKYVGRHDLVALKILQGEFDLGGIKSDIVKHYYHLGLQEIAITKPFPMFAMVANTQSVSKDRVKEFRHALLNVETKELATWGGSIKYGAVETNDTNYNPIREMKKNITIPLNGNF